MSFINPTTVNIVLRVIRWAVRFFSTRTGRLLKKDSGSKLEMAKCPETSPGDLKRLAVDESKEVRQAVARNPNTPARTIKWLIRDVFNSLSKPIENKKEKIREAVAANPSTSAELLAQLAEDSNLDVRRAVAANPSTSAEVLAELAKNKSSIASQEI